MPNLDEKLAKSLEEIEALADEMLSKSEETEVVEGASEEGEDIEKGLKPEDVSSQDDEAKQSEDDGKDDDKKDDEGEDKEDDKDEDDEEKTQKSFAEMLSEEEEISKALDVSEFLSGITRVQSQAIDSLRYDVAKSLESSSTVATVLAKSFNAIMKSQNELAKSLADLTSRLDKVERQPVGRKAVVNVMEKSFSHSAGISGGEGLSKSEKLDKLTNMAMGGTNGVTIQDVVTFESTGHLRSELESLFTEQN